MVCKSDWQIPLFLDLCIFLFFSSGYCCTY
ncbi:hypothetical protein Golax_005337 [Gossypium laxum]|uniref:Uncharacterized protein n=1 Tax=Gossypium laxum TaxID=34288 RepID=A0A7J9A1V1_9ROSI|nr:hypothetical protein [Gossypium laxum]